MRNYIKFLGTAGARFVVAKQKRYSGGIWCQLQGLNLLVDPGPGTLTRCFTSKPKLDPETLDVIILTHRHLDHSSDMNIMVEAMTGGTFHQRGKVFLPEDALNEEPVLYSYLQASLSELNIIKAGGYYNLSPEVKLSTPIKHIHSVETYGLKLELPSQTISLITDTRPFPELPGHYQSDVLILNVVLYQPIEEKAIQHLDVESASSLIAEVKPKLAILNHFGMTMLKQHPWKIAQHIATKTGVNVIAAYDGFTLALDEYIS